LLKEVVNQEIPEMFFVRIEPAVRHGQLDEAPAKGLGDGEQVDPGAVLPLSGPGQGGDEGNAVA